MIILKGANTIPDNELLVALKKYQKCNNLYYRNMSCFQQFVQVTHLFGDLLFEPDGTLAVKDDNETGQAEAAATVATAAAGAEAAAEDLQNGQRPTEAEVAANKFNGEEEPKPQAMENEAETREPPMEDSENKAASFSDPDKSKRMSCKAFRARTSNICQLLNRNSKRQ